MIVNISQFALGVAQPAAGDYETQAMDLDTADIEFTSSLHFEGQVTREEDVLTVKGELTGRWRERCARCLAASEIPMKWPIDLVILIRADQRSVDFTDEIREEVLLSYPVKYLCTEDCKGLCPKCGANLNVAACECRGQSEGTHPFDVLMKLKEGNIDAKSKT